MSGQRTPIERLWLAGGALVVGVVLAAGWLTVVRPELGKADQRHEDAQSAQDSNLALLQQVVALRSRSGQLGELAAQVAAAYQALPATPSLDAFTRELSGDAAASGVTLSGISVGPPTGTGPAAGAASGTATAGATGTTAAAGAAAAGAAAAGQSRTIAVTVTSTGPVAAEQNFVQRVQGGARAATITSVGLTSQSGGVAAVTIALRLFVQPRSAQQTASLGKLLAAAGGK